METTFIKSAVCQTSNTMSSKDRISTFQVFPEKMRRKPHKQLQYMLFSTLELCSVFMRDHITELQALPQPFRKDSQDKRP